MQTHQAPQVSPSQSQVPDQQSPSPGSDWGGLAPGMGNAAAQAALLAMNTPTTQAPQRTASAAGSGLNEAALSQSSEAAAASAPSDMRERARAVIPRILRQCAESGLRSVPQVAYILATAEHESNYGLRRYSRSQSFVEDRNGFSQGSNGRYSSTVHVTGQQVSGASEDELETKYWDNAYGGMLGNTPGTRDARNYRGRGLVQLTGRSNYANMSKQLTTEGFSYTQDGVTYGGKGNPPIDLVKNFEHVNKNVDLASRVMISGMVKGSFTGRKLGDYVNGSDTDYTNARRVVNGDVRQNGGHIARIAGAYQRGLSSHWAKVFNGQSGTGTTAGVGAGANQGSGSAPGLTLKRVLRLGDTGPDVQEIQRLLGMQGAGLSGQYGATTQQFVLEFQRAHKIQPTGEVGPTTLQILQREAGRWRPGQSKLQGTGSAGTGSAGTGSAGTGSAPARTHVVRDGDTLFDLAERLLGDSSRWPELVEANRDRLPDPDHLEVGTVLRLPAATGNTGGAPKPTPETATGNTGGAPKPTPETGKNSGGSKPSTDAQSKQSLDEAIRAGRVFGLGDKGPAVVEIQKLLGLGTGGQTGEYGATTEQAVREFQASRGIQVNGKIGPTTLAALRRQSEGSKAPILDQYRMNHEYKGGFCGIATLISTIEGMGKNPGVDINSRSQLERFSSGIYTPGQGSSGTGMAAKMREFGMKEASFTTQGSISTIMRSLEQGKPVPVGVVSMGGEVVQAPKTSVRYGNLKPGDRHAHKFGASGHWVTVVGYEGDAKNPTHFLVNDSDTGTQLRLTRAELERHSAAHEGIWMIPH